MTPDEQHHQRMNALAMGNEKRLLIAETKRKLANGEIVAAELLRDLPPAFENVKVAEILTWLPGVKGRRAAKIMRNAMLFSTTITMDALSPARRETIISQIEHYQPSRRMAYA